MTPLIPRDVLFGNPERTGAQISPDGSKLVYLAPSDGVLAVWVRTIGLDDDRVVARDPERPIRLAQFAPDGGSVVFEQDKGGDENFHVYTVGLDGGEPVDLTPFPGVRADLDTLDPLHPETLLVTMNRRDPRVFDMWRVAMRTGELTLDTENPGNVAGWMADASLVVRAGVVSHPDASREIIVRDSALGQWRTLATYGADDALASPLAFTPDGAGLYVVTSQDANAARLLRYDLAGGEPEAVAADRDFDVSNALISVKTHKLGAVLFERDRAEWTVIDPEYAADFEALKAAAPGDFAVHGSDRDDRTWIVAYTVDDGSSSFWTYDRASKRASKLFDTRPALASYTLSPMRPIVYAARDGLNIHGYLTFPAGVAPRNLPMVLLVHGGPWARDRWGFNGYVQWLANRGYAVLQPNFRSSTGYGKAFLNAGDREWAGAMHTDLLDAKEWAVREGYANPEKVAIMGGSYGGYATLTALTLAPQAFTCGVDVVGPSNLNTLLASIPPYWETARAEFARRMGDDPAFLDAQSPLFKADCIARPLLVGQGANDPRVNVRESDQIVAAMRAKELPVTYVVFPDEGHGFVRPENNNRFNAEIERFLAQYLGGRAEPAKPDESIEPFLR